MQLTAKKRGEAEAATFNTNNSDTNNDEAGPSTSGIASPYVMAVRSIEDNLITPLRPILKTRTKPHKSVNS